MPVHTAKVQGRRSLNFQSYEDLLHDAQTIVATPHKTLGNWTTGQILQHLALTLNGSIEGMKLEFPWLMRRMSRIFKKQVLRMKMPAGFKLPKKGGETLKPAENISAEEGLRQLSEAIERLERVPERAPHPMMGNLSREEWDKIHFSHASLHMSFLVPE